MQPSSSSAKRTLSDCIHELVARAPGVTFDESTGAWSLATEAGIYEHLATLLTDAFPGEKCEICSWDVENRDFRIKAPRSAEHSLLDRFPHLREVIREALQDSSTKWLTVPLPSESASLITLPLRFTTGGEEVGIGCILLQTDKSKKFFENMSPELPIFAALCARTVYENRLVERWKTLIDTEADVLAAADLPEILLRVLKAADSILNCAVSLACYDFTELGAPKCKRVSLNAYVDEGAPFTLATSVRATGRVTLWPEPAGKDHDLGPGLGSLIGIPVRQAGSVLAVLVYGSSVVLRFGDQECFFLQNLAKAAAHGLAALEARKSFLRDAVVGSTATALVHDLSQYAAIVRDVLGVLKAEVDPEKPAVRNALARAERAYVQLHQIVADVQTYVGQYQQDPLLLKEIDINEVVRETLQALNRRNEIPSYARLETRIASPPLRCRADQLLLRTFVEGLVRNAIRSLQAKALQAHGRFEGSIRVSTSREDAVATVIVSDNGAGISDIDLATKYRSTGGLGFHLPFTADVIKTYWGGELALLSPNDLDGTTVTLRIPLMEKGA
jgi:signal transduction histidine kinase